MKALVFDIETKDIFDNIKKKPEDLNISVIGIYSYANDKYTAYTEDELPKLWEELRNIDTLIGFNSNHFDIPLLNKYAPMDLVKEYKSIDILETVKESLGRRIRLDWIAKGTLNKSKSGSGLDAVLWWEKGEIDKIKKYCLQDVKITKEIYEYALKHDKLIYDDLGSSHTIQINTIKWKDEVKKTVTPLF